MDVKPLKLASVILMICFFGVSGISMAQDLTFCGFTKLDNDPIEAANIKVYRGDQLYAKTESDNKGFFSLTLEFNLEYKIYFEKEGFCKMFLLVDGKIPDDKSHYKIKYEITVPFYRATNKYISKKEFDTPFTKVLFDGKTKFIDDDPYMKEFITRLSTLPEEKPVEVVTKVVEKKHHIAGKVLKDDGFHSPFNLLNVYLIDTAGKEIAKTLTNKFGVFSFPRVGCESTGGIRFNSEIAINEAKLSVINFNNDVVAGPSPFMEKSMTNLNFTNTKENHLIEKLITDSYMPFIAGKFTYEENGETKILADKNVYLYSDKNELLEKTQTNIFGNFLFSKLGPDKNFRIAVDEGESGLSENSKLHLFSANDEEIAIKDSLIKGKHAFNFLNSEVKSYNELLVEDADIKMDLKGRLVGDNENNPLNNLHMLLLDNNEKVIDSAVTDKNGNFNFRYLPFSKAVILRILDTLEVSNFSSLMLYDKKGELVKYITIKKGARFDYKLLSSDLNRIEQLYVDDPWLTLTKNDFKKPNSKSLVIIENIYFEFNKAELVTSAKQILDKAILVMQNNPNMRIEISAHSDSKGGDDYNLKLSDKRAQSALQYIISKNIKVDRVSAKGFGEKKLLNKCGNNIICPEEEHAKNRRLEFNIILNQ